MAGLNRVSGRVGILSLVGVLLVFGVVYAFFDPSQTWWMPRCPVNYFTGLQCPGCGSQRAVHALLHGELREAVAYNALLVFFIPFVALSAYAELVRGRHPRLYRLVCHPAVVFSILAAVIVWTVVRNL